MGLSTSASVAAQHHDHYKAPAAVEKLALSRVTCSIVPSWASQAILAQVAQQAAESCTGSS